MGYFNLNFMRCGIFFLFTTLCCFSTDAQNRRIITCIPEHPGPTEPVSIIYDATQGNGVLAYIDEAIYAHTGATIGGVDWLFSTNWNPPFEDKHRLTPLGDNKWRLDMPDGIRSFYGIDTSDPVQRLSFIFRTADNSRTGKEAGETNILLDIQKPARLISTYPETLYDDKQSVTFTFDASQGNQGLKDHVGDVYAHTGVITNLSQDDFDWKYATNWNDLSSLKKLQKTGDNKWELNISEGIRNAYHVPEGEVITKIVFVFRDASGNKQGKNANNSDILLNLSDLSTTAPIYPFSDQAITVLFNTSQGNQALKEYDGDIYAHTGVITDQSLNDSDWKYATTWDAPLDEKYKLTDIGGGIYQLAIPDITAFYEVSATETVEKLVFVLRNEDGSKVAKTKDDKDILVRIYQPGIATRFETPKSSISIKEGETAAFAASSSTNANLKLYFSQDPENPIETTTDGTKINATYLFDNYGEYELVVNADDGTNSHTSSINVTVLAQTEKQAKPAQTRPGINYNSNDPSEVTLVLQAPYKQHMYVIGDFNNWTYSSGYQMKQDGEFFWITLTGLTPGEEYAYQYVVDGDIRIADPYTDKVLDPWNDQAIPSGIYPDLKPYPVGKTEGIVSTFQTGQEPYQWKATDFEKPAKDNLIIYEMHLRDFTEEGSYKAALEKLPYLKTLGINAIELMPVNEFEGNDSWGYNPSFYFAVDKAYGTKNDLRQFIDECHSQGIAVIIDMVLNHSFGQSPLFHLYKDEDGRPSLHNPWYNQQSNFGNPDAQWGVDFNHESEYTRTLVDSVSGFWINEYKIDGIRYDFTKGFSNTPFDAINDPWGSAYDTGRIYNLSRMAREVWNRDPNAYVIFEHLTPQNAREEKELAIAGIMLWRNMNEYYTQTAMGYSGNSAFTNLYDWDTNVQMPTNSLVGYMESHDEPRTTEKAENYGTGEIKASLLNRMKQAANNAAFFLTVPGPKMIWQFGELGYDYDINYNGRTGRKPVRWDFYDDDSRKMLHDTYSKLINLRQEHPELFNTRSSELFQWYVAESNWESGRKIICQAPNGKKMSVAGNFSGTAQNISVYFPETGIWHEYMSNTTLDVTANNMSVSIPAYEFRLYVNFDPGTRKIYTSDLEAEKLAGLENICLKGEGWSREKIELLAISLRKEPLNDKLKEMDLSEIRSIEGNLEGLLHNCASVTNIYLPEGNYQGQLFNEASNPNCFVHLPAGTEELTTFPETDWVNVLKDGVAQTEIVITNEAPFYLSKPFIVNSGNTVTYTRTFDGAGRDGGWETIWLPFTPTAITDSEKGNRTPVAEEQSGNFWLKKYSGSMQTGEVSFINSASMDANIPYIIAFPGTAWGNQYKDSWEITFTGSDGASFNPDDKIQTAEGNLYSFVGELNAVTNNTSSPLYYIYNKEDNLFEKASNSQKHFNAYFIDQKGNSGARSLKMGNGSTTGFDQLTAEDKVNIYGGKGRIVIEVAQKQLIQVFDLAGKIVYNQSVEQGTHSISLPQGIYIIRNQKVAIH